MSKKTTTVNKDAGTGKFVTNNYVKNHPKTTVTQTVKVPHKKK